MTWKSPQREKRGWLPKGPQHNAHRGSQLKAKRVRDQWEAQGHWCSQWAGLFVFCFFVFNFILFNFTILYWFCHISKWICPRYTCVPHSEPSSLCIPPFWVVPVHQPQASSIVHRTWTGDSFHIWYYTYFNAILPNLPTLSLSHRVQKTVLYISVSFAVSYTGLLLPSF